MQKLSKHNSQREHLLFQLLHAAKSCRVYQNAYLKNKSSISLQKAKAAEKIVDEIIADYIQKFEDHDREILSNYSILPNDQLCAF